MMSYKNYRRTDSRIPLLYGLKKYTTIVYIVLLQYINKHVVDIRLPDGKLGSVLSTKQVNLGRGNQHTRLESI